MIKTTCFCIHMQILAVHLKRTSQRINELIRVLTGKESEFRRKYNEQIKEMGKNVGEWSEGVKSMTEIKSKKEINKWKYGRNYFPLNFKWPLLLVSIIKQETGRRKTCTCLERPPYIILCLNGQPFHTALASDWNNCEQTLYISHARYYVR